MTFRRKLLLVLALTVFFTVGAVSWIVSLRTRRAFEQADADRTAALVAQFRREFTRRGDDVVHRVEGIAAGDAVRRMAAEIARGADVAPYLTEAKPLADAHQLEFLEILTAEGAIVSSAQWPARFGYKETLLAPPPAGAFLKTEELPDGSALGLFAIRGVGVSLDAPSLFVIGGQRVDRDFLASLTLPAGMRALLYRNIEPAFTPHALISAAGPVVSPEKLAPLIQRVQQQGTEITETVEWTGDPAAAESFHAIPLKSDTGALLGVLLVGSSRRGIVDLQQHIRAVGLIVGGLGILIAILLSGWVAALVTRPVEQLAAGARQVAAGNWQTRVEIASRDELGELAEAFNRMTGELREQRERLVQAERVAAWRELARRLAHELKNPLFPLQITVENLLRARETSPQEFDEVFRESTATLLAEIANLKTIIGRFSDFSKMPQPQLQPVQINDLIQRVIALHEPQIKAGCPTLSAAKGGEVNRERAMGNGERITTELDLDPSLPVIAADPDLLYRVFSNLVLNAIDAMPQGGALRIRTRNAPDRVHIEVADTGTGLTPEETARLFTPYYTTKQPGTGLGLAIVQSVVSDHGGNISVESAPGKGACFHIELPKHESALAADEHR